MILYIELLVSKAKDINTSAHAGINVDSHFIHSSINNTCHDGSDFNLSVLHDL
jgi:hypothetical protein